MNEHIVMGLAGILVLGISAQWLAWRLNLPSILLLLLFGFLAGPVTQLVNPDQLFGSLLLPLVSVSVALILFEGGLTLRFSELKETGGVVRNLITIGALVTLVLITVGAYYLLRLPFQLALLLGAILVVSGPTVIGPLLLHVRPSANVSSILKWEGILIDPIGALMAILVFEVIIGEQLHDMTSLVLVSVLKMLVVGTVTGIIGALILVAFIRRYWLPGHLQNPFSLMVVVGIFVFSNWLVEESGLLAVTVMGIYLANQKYVSIREMVDFKEDLRVLLLSSLFIVLVSRLQWSHFQQWSGMAFVFLLYLLLIARPIPVFLSSWRSPLTWNERLFLAWVAPRGIVAASIASIFSLRLVQEGYPEAEILVAIVFLVIIGTVCVYGFSAGPVGRWLKVAQSHPDGILFLGAHDWAVRIAKALKEEGVEILMADTNRRNIFEARMEGLQTYYGNILAEYMLLGNIGRVFSMTSNEDLNGLASVHFSKLLDRADVFQLAPKTKDDKPQPPNPLQGRLLFGSDITYPVLQRCFNAGFVVKKTSITDEFPYADFQTYYQNQAIPLFLKEGDKRWRVFAADVELQPKAGDTLISLVPALRQNGG